MNAKYIALGILRRLIPADFLFVSMKCMGKSNLAEVDPGAYYEYWRERFTSIGWNLEGRRILEVGSGRYSRMAVQLLAAGAEHVTLIDLYAVDSEERKHRSLLLNDCSQLGLNYQDVKKRISIFSGDFLDSPIPKVGGQVDAVISCAVLEHVVRPDQVLKKCFDWLKPGGLTYHVIDLRDHNCSFQYPFEMLTFSERTWRIFFDLPGGFHLNRWRVPDYLEAMQESRFVNIKYVPSQTDYAGLNKILPRLNAQFARLPVEILSIVGIYLYGEKP
jgi:SAM-dependent methyltransferase